MKEKGFTLIELLVVLALISILAAILIVVIKPAQIFMKGRDAQRQGDLRNLSQAVDAYLTEAANNPINFSWPARGSCSNIFFSTTTMTALTGWPVIPSGYSATGTANNTTTGSGWVPLDFTKASVVNLSVLPLDPRNGQTATVNGTSIVFAYSFACSSDYNYEFAAKLEGNISAMVSDSGNRNNCGSGSVDCLYEVGPGKASLY